MKKQIKVALTIIIAASLSQAATYIPEIKEVTTPALLQELTNANQAAATNNYSAAINNLSTALTLTDSPEFADPDQASGPMSLQIEMMKLYYTGKQTGFSPATILQEANQLINIYTTQETSWYAYGKLYQIIAKHHAANNEKAAVVQAYKNAITYLPRNAEIMTAYINWAITNNQTDKLTQHITKYKQTGGILPVKTEVAVIKELKAKNDSATYNYTKTFLTDHPTQYVNQALTIMRAEIDINNISQIKDYYDFLSWLALNQPSNEANIEQISQILNEREKVLLIFPEM